MGPRGVCVGRSKGVKALLLRFASGGCSVLLYGGWEGKNPSFLSWDVTNNLKNTMKNYIFLKFGNPVTRVSFKQI